MSLGWPAVSGADPWSRFKPLSGYLVEVGVQGVVIDCGRRKGVSVGDLFAVMAPGAPLIHPRTGQSLGTQERLLSSLKVMRVEADFAVCQPLQRYLRVPLQRGALVRRFNAMSSLFIDLQGDGKELFGRLREALPQLNWADYGVGLQLRQVLQRPGGPGAIGYDLYVVNQGPGLSVYNGDQELVVAWNDKASAFPLSPNAGGALKAEGKGRYALSTADADKAFLTRYRELAEVNLVVRAMDVGDLDRNGMSDVVFSDGEKIYVYQLTEAGLKYRYRYHFDRWGSIISLQVGDIDGDRRDEIMVNTFKETEDGFSSFVIADNGGKFQVIAENIPFVMGLLGGRSVADPGVSFVGQGFAEEVLFNNRVVSLEYRQGEVRSLGTFSVPNGFTLPGAVYEDINNDRVKELCFINKQNFLEIYQGSKRLWVSDERVAGSLHDVQYEVGTRRMSYTEKRQIASPLRVVDLDQDGCLELLLVDNESGLSTALGEYGFLSKGRIKMVKAGGSGFVLRNVTGVTGGPLQGLQIINDELVCAMVRRGDDLLKLSGSTTLLAFPLTER
ncbi:MAG: hypothetical protein JXR89_01975 [Deltaproteobacteria bacterium]|nr:hypothetical protein [Deltaproteobacteria bacterium]